jgi:uncharacterized sulfatase
MMASNQNKNKMKLNLRAGLIWAFLMIMLTPAMAQYSKTRPNILFIITDDQSWKHLGCYGDRAVRTPAVDELAAHGVRFANAYCGAPSCSPSRASILTGQAPYRLEEGGVLTGILWKKYQVFPFILADNGYTVGATGKRYWPAHLDRKGAYSEAVGKVYQDKKISAPDGISKNDYAANFEDFLDQTSRDKPFFFWMGMNEPHIPHPHGLGIQKGIDTSKIEVPSFYPDVPEVRLAMSDYLGEVEWADAMVGRVLKTLEQRKLLDNTLIVFTSDNGMPFPRAKATLYDYGVRMPLIVDWKGHIQSGRVVTDPVSLVDLAPTFLELAKCSIPTAMTGRSLNNILFSDKQGKVDSQRKFVVTMFEKHTLCRPGDLPFPRRAIHTVKWTYIRNYEPDRWPAGTADKIIPNWGPYGDVDPSGVKTYFMDHQKDPAFSRLFNLSFGKVPGEELFDKEKDPEMIHNLAADPAYHDVLVKLRTTLEKYLKDTRDPRAFGQSPWDAYNLDH